MTTNPIPLDRQFVRWDGEGAIDADLARYLEGLGNNFDWDTLVERRRVVILAEAGSGKSTEFREQARLMSEQGRSTFITTLQKIGQRAGLQAALGQSEWRRFEQWQATGDPCWLFLDSVDEAKRADFTLFDILTDVADAIDGFSARVHNLRSARREDHLGSDRMVPPAAQRQARATRDLGDYGGRLRRALAEDRRGHQLKEY
jgi:hypothetical protein